MNVLRKLFLSMAAMVLGIWLSGFDKVRRALHLPVALLTLVTVTTGVCPVPAFWSKVGSASEPSPCSVSRGKT